MNRTPKSVDDKANALVVQYEIDKWMNESTCSEAIKYKLHLMRAQGAAIYDQLNWNYPT